MLRLHGHASLAEFLGDLVVYRSLIPCDPRLPDVDALRSKLGLQETGLPRKTEPSYARVVAEMVRDAHLLEGGDGSITAVVVIGDTEHNDGTAFRNLCEALDCPGSAFIGTENDDPPRLDVRGEENREVCLANRWQLLTDFDRRLVESGLEVGPATAVVVDIDKTALGARGRNHRPIDAARIDAVRRVAADVLGAEVDLELAIRAYGHLNRPRYHPFTTDNQDYLAYVCLLVGAGWTGLDELAGQIDRREIESFGALLARVSSRRHDLPPTLGSVHDDVAAAVAAGDPTPFKRFRKAEYLETIARMRHREREEDVDEALASRITLTHEVRARALEWKARGALLLGLSDKPDEASLPTPELADQGFLPIHQTAALVVGEET
jgi:hypothetical protein